MLWLVLLGGLATSSVVLSTPSPAAALFAWPLGAVVLGVLVSYTALWIFLRVGKNAADWVTLGRFLIVSGCCAWALLEGQVTWPVLLGLTAGVCCDLLDGYVARRFGASDEGAVLDMETDQLITLSLASLSVVTGALGVWILLVPAFRYVYVRARGYWGALQPKDAP